VRYYYPIWSKLKALPKEEAFTKGISITAPTPLHSRIIKAVGKEKWMDFGYKILLKEQDDQQAILFFKREHARITFFLRFTIGIKDLES
jgi:hypothetical protein